MEEFNSADILKKQNRKKKFALLEIGLFEISFVLIIIIVLFGLLNYFNILSLSTLYPNQLGFLPHQQITGKQLPKVLEPTPEPAQTNNVFAISDIPSYTLTIIDKNALISYINDFNIWGRSYNEKANETILKKIIFRLSNTEGRINQLIQEPDGTPMFSSEYSSNQDTLDISIYINPKELASENRSDVFDKAVIANIYHISLLNPIPQDVETKAIMDLYERKEKNNNHFFTILKR